MLNGCSSSCVKFDNVNDYTAISIRRSHCILKGCNSLSLFPDFSATPALPTKPCNLKPIQSVQLLAPPLALTIHPNIAVSLVSVLQVDPTCV